METGISDGMTRKGVQVRGKSRSSAKTSQQDVEKRRLRMENQAKLL
jgi:hypothetical protein